MFQMQNKEFIVSIYGSHNAAIAFYYKGKIDVYEVERYVGYKNSGLSQYKFIWPTDIFIDLIIKDYKLRNNINQIPDVLLWSRTDCNHNNTKYMFHENIETKECIPGALHHMAHASGTFYQSTFNKALVISFDGGGEDGFFNIYFADRETGCSLISKIDIDLGFAYMILAHYLKDINRENSLSDGNLIYSGKLMGLTGYGKLNPDWLPAFKQFYYSKPDGNNYTEKIKILKDAIGVDFNDIYRLSGYTAYNIAATHQQAFEDVFFEKVDSIINDYPDLPICVTGGCALNVLLNTNIKKKYNRQMFVASNSNDCGQAAGMLLEYLKPPTQIDLSRTGTPILDYGSIGEYMYECSNKCKISKVTNKEVIELLQKGKIIGVLRGLSEHGPRALGHRSIICDPGKENMKDVLNQKVKNREWYRPFAPIALVETANNYFDITEYSPYMSFAFDVREEWKSKLKSVTHIDGTARVQTLKREDDAWLYDLIKDFGAKSGYEVILNTSFNVNGKPILTTVKDAFKVFNTTKLDCLIIEDNLIVKNQ